MPRASAIQHLWHAAQTDPRNVPRASDRSICCAVPSAPPGLHPYNAMMALTERQKKHLRRLGHELHPIVLVGQKGLTSGVAEELRLALEHHELVKLRARVGDREERDSILGELARLTGSEFIYRIGNVGLFYKKNSKLPKIL